MVGGAAVAKNPVFPVSLSCVGDDDSTYAVWFPNAFTPQESTNCTFKVKTDKALEYYRLYIYNRAGVRVFYSENPVEEWDGKYDKRFCEQGAYVYVCTYRCASTGKMQTQSGTVLIIE